MTGPPRQTATPDVSPLLARVEGLRAELRQRDPADLAARTGGVYAGGEIRLSYWGRAVHLAWPDLLAREGGSGAPLDPLAQAMLAYYLHDSDGSHASGAWIAFSDLPGGRFYAQAFQGYTGAVLGRVFGDEYEAFGVAAEAAGGRSQPLGSAAYAFPALPHLPLLVVCWLGDEDFPTSYRILFDSAAPHHVSTDACAILGSMLTRMLVSVSIGSFQHSP